MEINMRRELVKWLEKRGHWVVLRSFQVPRLAATADKETGQNYNNGNATGKEYIDFLVKSDRRKSVPDFTIDTMIGDANVGIDTYYLQHHSPAKTGDLIIEIELDSEGKPVTPVKIVETFKIVESEVMRDGANITAGRVEFYQCRVEKMSVRT